MITFEKIYDISVTYGSEAIDYPGDISFSRKLFQSINDGGFADVSRLSMSVHSGTHLDLPSHFNPGGKSITDYRAEDFILPALVIEIKDKQSVKIDELKGCPLREGDALLFKTNNSLSGKVRSGVFSKDFVYVSPEAADYCVQRHASLVGIDYSTVDKFADETFPAHRKLLCNSIMIMEGINLKEVPAGRYTFFCLPLKILKGEASPVRAILIQ